MSGITAHRSGTVLRPLQSTGYTHGSLGSRRRCAIARSNHRAAGLNWLYMDEGLSHRQKMLNGYSGYVPASYYAMIDSMRSFRTIVVR